MFRRTLLQRLEFENSNRGRVLCLRMFCAAKRREALQITLIIDIKREIRRCQIKGGAVLDSCFVQIRTHQQHFALYQFLRAGALTGTKLAPTHEMTRVRSYDHRTLYNDDNSKIPIEGVSYV